MKLSEVAIVTLNWRQPQATIKCVRSILNASADPSQVFIVDNGSKDGSLEVFKSNLPKVAVIPLRDNFGFGGGFNAGIKRISPKFKFYLLTNNDVVFDEDSLSELVNAATRLGEDNIYHPVIIVPGTKDRILSGGMLTPIPTPFQLMKWGGRRASKKMPVEEVPYLSGCCFLVSKKLFDDLHGIKADFFLYGEDVDFGLRARKCGAKIFAVPGSRIYHFFQGSSSWFSPLSRYYIARNVPRIIKEHSRFKAIDFFRFYFWGFTSLVIMLFTLRWKAISAYLRGAADSFKGKTGKSELDF